MSVLNDKAIEDLKWNYNHNLNRYYKGCEYCSNHKKDRDKWIPELLEILNNLNLLLDEIMANQDVTEDEILQGFAIQE